LQCVRSKVVPILCVVAHQTCVGRSLGMCHIGHRSCTDGGSSLCLAIASASYGGQRGGGDGGPVVLHASVGTLGVEPGVGTLESAISPRRLDGTPDSYSRLQVATYAVMLVEVANREEIFAVVVGRYAQIFELPALGISN